MSAVTISAPSGQVLAAIDRWHRFVRGDDPAALDELLHDDVVLHWPMVFTPPQTNELVAMDSRT